MWEADLLFWLPSCVGFVCELAAKCANVREHSFSVFRGSAKKLNLLSFPSVNVSMLYFVVNIFYSFQVCSLLSFLRLVANGRRFEEPPAFTDKSIKKI